MIFQAWQWGMGYNPSGCCRIYMPAFICRKQFLLWFTLVPWKPVSPHPLPLGIAVLKIHETFSV